MPKIRRRRTRVVYRYKNVYVTKVPLIYSSGYCYEIREKQRGHRRGESKFIGSASTLRTAKIMARGRVRDRRW